MNGLELTSKIGNYLFTSTCIIDTLSSIYKHPYSTRHLNEQNNKIPWPQYFPPSFNRYFFRRIGWNILAIIGKTSQLH